MGGYGANDVRLTRGHTHEAAAALAAGVFGLAACAAAVLIGLLVVWFTLRRIPGLTGDVYGALCELVETAVVLVFCVAL